MKEDILIVSLRTTGLSENEARVYLATLSLGPASVLKIAKKSGIPRSSLYYILENLTKKGLIAQETRGFKIVFVAEDPRKLKSILELHTEQFDRNLPSLLALHNARGTDDVLKRYDGVSQIKLVYEQILKEAKPRDYYLVISNADLFFDQDPTYFKKFVERRGKLKMNIRMLLQPTEVALDQQRLERNFGFEVKYLPEGTSIQTSMVITPSLMFIQQTTAPFKAISTNNKDFIETQRQVFEVLWST
jgi:predicted transcriptional regulator